MLDVLLASDRPHWGLEIIKATGRASGSVYPLLRRLEQAGWVSSRWDDDEDHHGPRRRLYVLTPDGAGAARRVCASRRSERRHSPAAPGWAR